MTPRRLALLLALGCAGSLSAVPLEESVGLSGLPPHDRVRVAEAFSLMAAVQDRVWPAWNQAPADLVLVVAEVEYLLRSPTHPEGFVRLEPDPLLGSPWLARKRSFAANLLATFPAFGPRPTIVVGTAEATGKTSTAWVLTVLHEHFHQLQYSDPAYWEESRELGLSGGDETGMWMLNYPFPYQAQSRGFAALSLELARLLEAPASAPPGKREVFWQHYSTFCRSLKPEDYRYLSLQLWQEGIARYVELRVAEVAATDYQVSPAFAGLADFQAFAEAAAALRSGILSSLRADRMDADGRVVFYAFGAGLGLLLDREGCDWQARYLREKFYLEAYRTPPSGVSSPPARRAGTAGPAGPPRERSRCGV